MPARAMSDAPDDDGYTPEQLHQARSDPFYAHEALDRSNLAATFFDENVAQHVYVQAHADLKAEAENLAERLGGLYQQIGQRACELGEEREKRGAAEKGADVAVNEGTRERAASGQRAMLIQEGDGNILLRVYDKQFADGFRDYTIRHFDLSVVIDDDSAAFFDRGDDDSYIDYTSTHCGREPPKQA